jgi:hypothetical protein
MPPQKRLSRKTVPSLIHPKAAGIDVGSRFHIAAIPDGLDPEPVKSSRALLVT